MNYIRVIACLLLTATPTLADDTEVFNRIFGVGAVNVQEPEPEPNSVFERIFGDKPTPQLRQPNETLAEPSPQPRQTTPTPSD
jgi:hypothetical protein